MGRVRWLLFASLFVFGCASIRPAAPESLRAGRTSFRKVGVLDFRADTVADYRRMVLPGDLIVNFMRVGRAAKRREWLFAVLPYGHSMVVLDPDDPKGLLECRFQGARRVGPEELRRYSYNVVYRLGQRDRLDLARLAEFADSGCATCRGYSFKSWVLLNDNLRPDSPDAIGRKYTCSTFVAAAYHYAGVTLHVTDQRFRVITPASLSSSSVTFNAFALPPGSSAEPSETPSIDSAKP